MLLRCPPLVSCTPLQSLPWDLGDSCRRNRTEAVGGQVNSSGHTKAGGEMTQLQQLGSLCKVYITIHVGRKRWTSGNSALQQLQMQ